VLGEGRFYDSILTQHNFVSGLRVLLFLAGSSNVFGGIFSFACIILST
jgi:hypothetical protein